MPWPITIFADEADSTAAGQAAFIQTQGLDGWDVRNINGRNVLDLLDSDVEEILATAIPVQAIGSPVNKVAMGPGKAEQEFEKFERAVLMAGKLGTKRIRLFTPEGDDWEGVKSWMRPMVDLAQATDLVILHENDAKFYGAYPENSKRLLAEFGGPNFKAAFDFANTVLIGFRPERDWFPWIVPHLDTLHIKDAVESEQRVVPAGQGDGEIAKILAYLREAGWQGTLTIEPHLKSAGPYGGFSGTDLCAVAVEALRALLEAK